MKKIYERMHPEASRVGDRQRVESKERNQTAKLAV